MKMSRLSLRCLLVALAFVLFSCSTSPVEPTASPTQTETPLPPTETPVPTNTLLPTETPDFVATQTVKEFDDLFETLIERGYIEGSEGEIFHLQDFKKSWAQINYYNWWPAIDGVIGDFVFKAHLKWATAHPTPDISGCGISFGIQENGDHYAVVLDQGRIVFLMGRGSHSYEVGVTRGSGQLNFENPAEADLIVVIHEQKGMVSVDGRFVDYTLSADQTSEGYFAYTLLSGTNRDYGTRCEITDAHLWRPKSNNQFLAEPGLAQMLAQYIMNQ